jgi:PmbA protein
LTAEQAVELAQRAEAAAFAVDKRITNSEGANTYAQQSHFVMANTRGFMGGYPYSRHSLSVSPIAGKGNNMQRDDWYSSDRDPTKLAQPEAIGRYAAERALSRLNARKLDTRKCPVLFEAPLAAGLLGSFVQAVSGGSLYRKSTFLTDSMGTAVFGPEIQIIEDPHVLGAVGSSPFDEEGVCTHRREVVSNGIVQGYFLSTYSARKLGMQTTGNAGGSHNLQIVSSTTLAGDDFNAMLKKLDTGLLVTELMGHGVNYVTGDYSRGASGYWVERGVIQYPVEEITIAGNMRDMFKDIVAIGSDVLVRGTKSTGSILISTMTIAGG